MKKIPVLLLLCLAVFTSVAQSNNPCSAPTLTVSTNCTMTASTTVGATQETDAANGGTPSCGSMGPDVWYKFVAPTGGTISLTSQAGSITDGVMALYSGACGSLTQIACSDDAVGLMPAITNSSLTPGATYYVRFWKYGGGTGTFNLCVTKPSANTTCALPNPICSGSPIMFTANTGGTPASTVNPGNNYGCLSTSPNPSWYYMEIATSGVLAIDITAGSDVDFRLWGPFANLAAAQAGCNSYTAAQSPDCSYSTSPTEQANANVLAGQVYVLLVTNYANTVQNISINEAVSNTASTNCAIVPLPVGYSSWDVSYFNEQVQLVWTTESEQNNNKFNIQRSSNGLVWETIGLVTGKGNSDQASDYVFYDKQPVSGVSYYRLQQVDSDGKFSYTSILSVSTDSGEISLKVFPNPAEDNFTIRTKGAVIDELLLTDLVGKVYPATYTTDGNDLIVNCEPFAQGSYTVTVISKGKRTNTRLFIKK